MLLPVHVSKFQRLRRKRRSQPPPEILLDFVPYDSVIVRNSHPTVLLDIISRILAKLFIVGILQSVILAQSQDVGGDAVSA